MTLLQLLSCTTSKKKTARDLAQVAAIKPLDAIIVPGIPFNNGNWDSVMKGRVLWSYVLYKNGYTKNVIYSGSAVYSPYFEAVIMGLYAEQLGIPREHIFCETKARHSTENVYYSYLMAKEHGFKSIGLATDGFQSSMLRSFTRKRFETHIWHLPMMTDSLAAYNHVVVKIDPTSAVAPDSFISITQSESFWKRIQGTLGKGIDWKQYPDRKVPEL